MKAIKQYWTGIFVCMFAVIAGCSDVVADQEISDVTRTRHAMRDNCTSGCTECQIDKRVEKILSGLSLEEKAGQMVQADLLDVIAVEAQGINAVKDLGLGSVLSGGSSQPEDNSPEGWQAVIDQLQADALASSGGIPIIYGIDSVHGASPVRGATIFPHNIGIGASRDPQLAYDIARISAKETAATGVDWTFGPCVAVSRDERWGRAYESYGETPELQKLLAAAQVQGFQGSSMKGAHIVATAKHFMGDGGTLWGTGFLKTDPVTWISTDEKQIDRGDTQGPLSVLKAIHAKGYEEAVEADVGTVMTSFSSINGIKMSAHKELITYYLKGRPIFGGLGFKGFVISDWNSIDEIPIEDTTDPFEIYKKQLVTSIDAGVDMFMVVGEVVSLDGTESEYKIILAPEYIREAVEEGLLTEERIDDAVSRILRIKIKSGLFNEYDKDGNIKPKVDRLRDALADEFGSAAHRELARKAVQKSLVLLKNERHTLPITKQNYDTLYVVGKNADNFGADCGGWTYSWQGVDGNENKSERDNTILDGITALAAENDIEVVYSEDASGITVEDPTRALAIAVVGESPYAEFLGDAADLSLDDVDIATLNVLYETELPIAVVMVSGRPMIVTDEIDRWNAFVAAWLPGSQAEGVADVLFGDVGFTGKLPMTWPKSMDQIPINAGDGQEGLFDYGFGLTYRDHHHRHHHHHHHHRR